MSPVPPSVAAQLVQRPIPVADAEIYADLLTHVEDMKRVARYGRALAQRLSTDGPDLICSALWESMIITYGRCFRDGRSAAGKGKRRRFPTEILEGMDSKALEIHNYALGLRDRHVGHRVDEHSRVQLVSLHPAVDAAPIGIGFEVISMAMPENFDELAILAELLADALIALANSEREQLLANLQASFGA